MKVFRVGHIFWSQVEHSLPLYGDKVLVATTERVAEAVFINQHIWLDKENLSVRNVRHWAYLPQNPATTKTDDI